MSGEDVDAGSRVTGRTALVVIDVQRGLIDGFEADWAETLPLIAELTQRARTAGAPVVLIAHCGAGAEHPVHPSRPGWALHPDLGSSPTDLLIQKRWSDAFCETELDNLCRQANVSRLVLVGAQTEYCIDATARRAASLGYDVDLVADGHTTSANGLLTRRQIIDHHNRTLPNLAVVGVSLRVLPAAQVVFG